MFNVFLYAMNYRFMSEVLSKYCENKGGRMNNVILDRAIEQVKGLFISTGEICGLCHKNKAEIEPSKTVDIIGIDTEIGVSVCQSCFDNILIAVGEISQEY